MAQLTTLTRQQFTALLAQGRKFVAAALYERQDYKVQLARDYAIVVRDVTDEPAQWGRKLLGRD